MALVNDLQLFQPREKDFGADSITASIQGT